MESGGHERATKPKAFSSHRCAYAVYSARYRRDGAAGRALGTIGLAGKLLAQKCNGSPPDTFIDVKRWCDPSGAFVPFAPAVGAHRQANTPTGWKGGVGGRC